MANAATGPNAPTSLAAVPPSPPPPAKPRLNWVDGAKGFGIVLVVFGHVWYGLRDGKIVAADATFETVAHLVYCFHMPLFFFLSGLFIERSALKGTGPFVVDKLATLIWPYVVWTLLQGTATNLMARYTNSPPRPFGDLFLKLFYEPYMHFWFLYVLFLYSLLFLVLYRLRLGLVGIFLVGVALYVTDILGESWRGHLPYKLLDSFAYLAAGALLSRWLVAQLPACSNRTLTVVVVLAGAGLVGCVLLDIDQNRWTAPLPACLGIAGTLAVAVLTARVPWLDWVRRLGELSLVIYLVHVLAAAGARIVLSKFLHVQDLTVHLVVGLAAGMSVPIAVEALARRLRMNWLFSLR